MRSQTALALLILGMLATFGLHAGDVSVPEGANTALQMTPVSALAAAMADTSTMKYYGAIVRSVYVKQPASGIVGIQQAHTQFGTGTGIVAIIDTGVDPYHPALKGHLVSGYNFLTKTAGIPNEWLDLKPAQAAALASSLSVSPGQKVVAAGFSTSAVPILDQSTVVILDGGGPSMPSEFGHGTMVAGLVHLVAPTAQIMPLKAFKPDGTANTSDVADAIRYAADNGANVINMSFSVTADDSKLSSAISYAASKGLVLVAASGNDGLQTIVYPAAYPEVIAVGSVNNYDLRSTFSNYGDAVARTSAPGEALITTYPGNNYAGVWGTSFSTALVSGAAAMVLQVTSTYTGSALFHGKPIDQDMGDTRLQIIDALTAAMSPTPSGN